MATPPKVAEESVPEPATRKERGRGNRSSARGPKNKPRPPRRRYQGIEARSFPDGWRWRAVITVGNRKTVGVFRDTQEQAGDDYGELRIRKRTLPTRIATLQEAIERVIADARYRGLPESTIKKQFESHAAWLKRFWKPECRMTDISAGEVRWFVSAAQEGSPEHKRDPRHPNTLLQKDLPLLHLCFVAAGLPSPVPEVRKLLRKSLRYVPPRMSYFHPPEIVEVLRRIREESFVDANGLEIQIPARGRHADILELLVRTGIRAGELGRIRVEDVEADRQRVRIVSKDRGNPRQIELVGPLVGIVERLVAEAERTHAAGSNPDRLLVPGGANTLANICRHWKRRLGEKRLSGRTLRHTFVTGLHYSGASPVEAMGLAGHRHLSTTDRYTHEITRRRADVLESWFRLLDGEEPKAPESGAPAAESSP